MAARTTAGRTAGTRAAEHTAVGQEVGAWALPLPTIDAQIVQRSARVLERYGPDFRYRHYAAVERLPVALGGVTAVGAVFAGGPGAARAALAVRPDKAGRGAQCLAAGEELVLGAVRGRGRRAARVHGGRGR